MAKQKSLYVCQKCGLEYPRWQGQCDGCGGWNSLVETVVEKKGLSPKSSAGAQRPVFLEDVRSVRKKRVSSGIGEVDRVLGGGFVGGQVVLLAGEPGIGKSTLLIQISANLKSNKGKVLYVSGEESLEQIKLRAERLKITKPELSLLSETNVDSIIASVPAPYPELLIVDSVQTVTTNDLAGTSGSVGQVRECSYRLSSFAKKHGIPLILVGHVTKEGNIAGPKVLEHLVDTVLYMEGDKRHIFRLLKTAKNRFGAVNEVGVFEMKDTGLCEVKNPSDLFLEERMQNVPGSAVTIVLEGTRPVALEIQALTTKTVFGYPKRASSGYPLNRLNLLCAVLQKRAGINLFDQDVYINVAGGVKITETACDLAVCLAIISSVKGRVINPKIAVVGEVGLSGEIRKVSRINDRMKEAKGLGFETVLSAGRVRSVSKAAKSAFL